MEILSTLQKNVSNNYASLNDWHYHSVSEKSGKGQQHKVNHLGWGQHHRNCKICKWELFVNVKILNEKCKKTLLKTSDKSITTMWIVLYYDIPSSFFFVLEAKENVNHLQSYKPI